MISNCGHDENGKYHGGKAGDQTGGEWTIRKWYNRPWMGIFRHPDEKIRACIGAMAQCAAANDKVGYDQYQRLTFWEQMVATGYYPENISVNCEADCSSGVAAIAKATGYRLDNKKLQNIPETMYTGNQKSILTKAGFEYLTDEKYLTSDAYLLPGDILYYNKGKSGHTAINLDAGKKATVIVGTQSSNSTKATDNSFQVTITSKYLRIRKGPGTNYDMIRNADGSEKYIDYTKKWTIVEVSGTWGKLSTGEGWISLNYTKKV